MLNVFTLSVVMQSVIKLCVVAPIQTQQRNEKESFFENKPLNNFLSQKMKRMMDFLFVQQIVFFFSLTSWSCLTKDEISVQTFEE